MATTEFTPVFDRYVQTVNGNISSWVITAPLPGQTFDQVINAKFSTASTVYNYNVSSLAADQLVTKIEFRYNQTNTQIGTAGSVIFLNATQPGTAMDHTLYGDDPVFAQLLFADLQIVVLPPQIHDWFVAPDFNLVFVPFTGSGPGLKTLNLGSKGLNIINAVVGGQLTNFGLGWGAFFRFGGGARLNFNLTNFHDANSALHPTLILTHEDKPDGRKFICDVTQDNLIQAIGKRDSLVIPNAPNIIQAPARKQLVA